MTHYITGEEAQVIALAAVQGKEYIDVKTITPNGEWMAPMCGTCGRIIHHPDCSKLAQERKEQYDQSIFK